MASSCASARIAIVLDVAIAYNRGIMRGVLMYASTRPAWRLITDAVHLDPSQREGDAMTATRVADGVIGHFPPPMRRRSDAPTVNVSDDDGRFGDVCVVPDNRAVGRLAAEHLAARGCRSYAYWGQWREAGRGRRYRGFAEGVAAAGGPDVVLVGERGLRGRESLLKDLPCPVGLFCANDEAGRQAVLAVQAAGLAVPEDVAVIGVDNDDLVCRSVKPELSSVALSLEEIGKRAAGVLDAMLRGEARPVSSVRIPPTGVMERGSSRLERVDDPLVNQAMRFMREQLESGIDVSAVVLHSGASRRTLEYRFRAALGRSPHAELQRRRCQRAADLMLGSRLPLATIAERCGFSSQSHFSRVFHKVMGDTPGAYRQKLSQA